MAPRFFHRRYMTKEQIQERIRMFEQNIQTLQGAVMDCNYWLMQLDKPEPVKTEENNG